MSNQIPRSFVKAKTRLANHFLIIFSLFFLPSCDFFEDLFETEVEYFGFNFFDNDGSIDKVFFDGYFTLGGKSLSLNSDTFFAVSVSQTSIGIKFDHEGYTYYLTAPFKNGSYNLSENYEDDVITFVGDLQEGPSGTGSISGLSVKAKDSYNGKGSFTISGNGRFLRGLGTQAPKSFDFNLSVDFDTERTAGSPILGGSTGGGTGSSGGSGSNSCINEIKAPILRSYWENQIKPGSATGTGRKVAANTIFSNYSASDVALVIDGTSGGTRYVVQIMLTASNLVAGKKIDFRNAGTGTGLTSTGAVGRLIAFNGSVNDDWRTNRDWGKNQDRGDLTIETVTPKITGTYSFQASGDGYPSLNNQYAEVSGRFCIDP